MFSCCWRHDNRLPTPAPSPAWWHDPRPANQPTCKLASLCPRAPYVRDAHLKSLTLRPITLNRLYWGLSQYKDHLCGYKDSLYKDKTVIKSSCLCNGNSYFADVGIPVMMIRQSWDYSCSRYFYFANAGICFIKIRWSHDLRIFIMGISIFGKMASFYWYSPLVSMLCPFSNNFVQVHKWVVLWVTMLSSVVLYWRYQKLIAKPWR